MGRQPVRLYQKGVFVGFRRSRTNQYNGTSLIKIQGVKDRKDTPFYLGKRVAFIYRATRKINNSRIRVIWGKITQAHGNSGIVRAKFRNNLPPRAMGATLRVMLYPSQV